MVSTQVTTHSIASVPPRIAIVLPCFNEQESLDSAVVALSSIMVDLADQGLISTEWFLFFVDDGSTDGTWKQLERIHACAAHVRGLKLSRNFGHQAALLAGLTAVVDTCDAAISIDADLQQDPAAIKAFVAQYHLGCDVVLGVRRDRSTDGWFKKRMASAFYTLMKGMGVRTVRNHADYRLLSTRALRALELYHEPSIFLRAMCLELGFKVGTVFFDVKERQFGSSKYNVRKMVRLALHGITSSSVVPLRLVTTVGFVLFFLSMAMGFFIAWRTIFIGDTVPGWASTTLPIYFIGGVQLLCLGVVGEYIGQIFATVRHRPRWIKENELD